MKLFILACVLIAPLTFRSQNIGINTTGALPDPSAILDVDADGLTKAGMLIPRLTANERNAIPVPATSLMIYNTTAARFEFFNGATWVPIATGGTLDDAYDAGGSGAGQTIIADAGPLTISGTDGIVATGNGLSGASAPSGAGVRMVWNPKRSAFRAGQVTSAQWDEANLGSHSAAFGLNNTASGIRSFATGSENTASGQFSVAMGFLNTSSGTFTMSMGSSNISTGSASIALGNSNTSSGNASFTAGQGNVAASYSEAVLGSFAASAIPLSTTAVNINDRLLTIGNGTSTAARSNALVLMKSGRLGLGVNSPSNLIHMAKTGTGEVSIRMDESFPSENVFTVQNSQTSGVNLNTSIVQSWIGAVNSATAIDGALWVGGLASDNQFSDILDITFQFPPLPAGAVIQGVQVAIHRNASGLDDIFDSQISLKSGFIVGSNRASLGAWSTFGITFQYGSSTDLWGLTITETTINSGQLGMRISYFKDDDFASTTSERGFIDMVRATVFYTDPNDLSNTVWSVGSLGGEFRVNDFGTLSSSPELAIGGDGVTTLKGLRISTGATSGDVLTSDATGNATWQVNPGLQDLALSANELSLSNSTATVDLTPYAGWSFGGNTITDPNTEFIGTSSNHDFNLSSNNITRLTVDNSGSIGINTTTPSRLLHILDNSTSTTSGQFYIEQAGSGDAFMHMGRSGSRHYSFGVDATDSKFKFATNASAAGSLTSTTLITVQPTGEVGIGTETPGQRLHISGAGSVIGKFTSTTGTGVVGIEFQRSGFANTDWALYAIGANLTLGNSGDDLASVVNRYQFQEGAFLPMSTTGTQNLGGTGNRWNTLFATNGTINTSDIRDKTNIQSIGYGLAEVMSLRPVRFTWKERPEEGEKLGLIAQELQEILPEVVRDWDWKEDELGQRTKVEAERLGVFYSDLIPVLIKAIQEQQESIEQLKARVEELEGE